MSTDTNRLLSSTPIVDVDAYLSLGGGEGLWTARRIGPEETISRVRASGLRGRGGAGFPTALKWKGIREGAEGQDRYVVCNAAEGEPGTFKDRAILRSNPFQVLEGIAIAALTVGAAQAYVGIKRSYELEAGALIRAGAEMEEAGLIEPGLIRVVEGPDDYLFGEEKALLEVIEGREALPRWYPPYLIGLGANIVAGVGAASTTIDEAVNPTLVNNVETLANVPHILRNGPEWFRSAGTKDSPGTMVFTISGDVNVEGVFELPLGIPLDVLVNGVGEGLAEGRRVKAVLSGASNPPLTAAQLETPLDFESMKAAGSGLGSGGFIVYDDTACMADVGAVYSEFLAIESCGQCPPCKLGTGALADRFTAFENGTADAYELEEMVAWIERVTDANRCGLGAGEQALAAGILASFADELEAHIGRGCDTERTVALAKINGYDSDTRRFTVDEDYFHRMIR